jgi:glycosyltransferase involved in cell wall biosynthesis
MRLSLVIPCYNESLNLPLLLQRCKALVSHEGIEVVLVDNGSTDDSPAVLEAFLPNFPGCRSIRLDVNQGYGYGILAGLNAARGDILGWTHADMQTDPMDAWDGLTLFGPNPELDFVKGRRYGRPIMDTAFTVGMSCFETALMFRPMWDINAQPTLFTRRFFETWATPPHDFALDLYAYYQARVQGLNVHRFPVLFGQRAHGISHWNVNWAAKKKFIRRTIDFSLDLKRSMKS